MGKKFSYKEIKEQIKQQVKIVDIAEELGFRVINKNHKISEIAEHDSVRIFNHTNTFYRFATGEGGDVISFMRMMPEINMSYQEAMAFLVKKIDPTVEWHEKPEERKVPVEVNNRIDRVSLVWGQVKKYLDTLPVPEREGYYTRDNRFIIAYLVKTRKIDKDIVYDMINKQLIFPWKDKEGRKSVVFVGLDNGGFPAVACRRSCSPESKFKSEFKGCDYSYGWLYDPDLRNIFFSSWDEVDPPSPYNPNKPLMVFESEIEKMSYMTLLKMQGIDIKKYAYLSTGSASKYHTILQVCQRHGYKEVAIAYNNDFESKVNTGQMFADKAIEELNEAGISTQKIMPGKYNDWNDMLCALKSEQSIHNKKEAAVRKVSENSKANRSVPTKKSEKER